jgi:hypothetical protein
VPRFVANLSKRELCLLCGPLACAPINRFKTGGLPVPIKTESHGSTHMGEHRPSARPLLSRLTSRSFTRSVTLMISASPRKTVLTVARLLFSV